MSLPKLWMQRLCSGDVPSVLCLYAIDAVLLATYEADPLQGHDQISAYLNDFVGQKPGLCGAIESEIVQRLGRGGCVAVSGIYSFRWQSGAAMARYTFVLTGGGIATHHSSETP